MRVGRRSETIKRTLHAGVTAGVVIASLGGARVLHASHSTSLGDDRRWIAQAGNGSGQATPLIPGFVVQTVLFDLTRFPHTDGQGRAVARPGYTRYLAWGTIPAPMPDGSPSPVGAQVAMSMSDNGISWTTPRPTVLRDANGTETRFLINDTDGYFDVTYSRDAIPFPSPTGEFDQFIMHYRILNGNASQVSSIHMAVSDDGEHWYGDRSVSSPAPPPGGPDERLVTGNPATFNMTTRGPTELVLNPAGMSNPACNTTDPDGDGPRTASLWNCPWVMLYDATDGVGAASVGAAFSVNGLSWRAAQAPLIRPGSPGTWDDGMATQAKIRLRPASGEPSGFLFDLYYAGGRSADVACDGLACLSLGTATSSDGISFAKTPENPVTPQQLLEQVLNPSGDPGRRGSLRYPVIASDAGMNGDTHARIYFTRLTESSPPSGDVFLAYTEPDPTQAPRIRISSPQGPFRKEATTPIVLYVTDTLGSSPTTTAVDAASLRMSLDGTPVSGSASMEPHLVGALRNPSIKVSVEGTGNDLADGLHVFAVSIRDLDGNEASASSTFVVDTTPPATQLSKVPSGDRSSRCLATPTRLGCQLGSIGRFEGETVEGSATTGTGIVRVEIFVTNPLGETKQFALDDHLITRVTEKDWRWAWVAPNLDPHFYLPGSYTISFLASDLAQSREPISESNTASVLVV